MSDKDKTEKKKLRGFALMTPKRRAEIAAMGGRSGKPENRYFARNKEAASAAGTIGGAAMRRRAKTSNATRVLDDIKEAEEALRNHLKKGGAR